MVTGTSDRVWHARLVAARLAFKEGDYNAARRNLFGAINFVETEQIPLTDDQQKDFFYMESLVAEAFGDYKAAEQSLSKALCLSPKKLGSNEHAIFMRRLAGVYRLNGDHAKSESLYREALAAIEFTSDKVQIGKALMGLGEVLHAQGDTTARSYLERALAVIESGSGKNSLLYGRCLLSLAEVMGPAEQVLSREYVELAVTIISCKAGPNHPLYACALKNLLDIVRKSNDEKSVAELSNEIRKSQLYLKTHDL